jgi:hypothetical protein
LSPPSSPPDARAAALTWSGPVLAALGLVVIAAGLTAAGSPLARWILSETLAPVNVLPLVALGVAFGMIGLRASIAAHVLFALGIAGGVLAEDRLLFLLDRVPGAATHMFLTGPVTYLAAGVALVVSARSRAYAAPPAAAVFGAMIGLSTKLTDPSLHEPAYTWTPILIAFWMVLAVALSLRGFWRGWFPVFGRILGSWMLAIGLLYGGVALIPKTAPPPPAVALPPASAPGNEGAIPGLPVPEQPAPFPGGADRFRQP